MVNKLDKQICSSDFKSYWLPHSFGLVPHLRNNLSKLQLYFDKHISKKDTTKIGNVDFVVIGMKR